MTEIKKRYSDSAEIVQDTLLDVFKNTYANVFVVEYQNTEGKSEQFSSYSVNDEKQLVSLIARIIYFYCKNENSLASIDPFFKKINPNSVLLKIANALDNFDDNLKK